MSSLSLILISFTPYFFIFLFFYFFIFSIGERNDVIHSKLELECAALRIEIKELSLKAKFSIDLGTFFFFLRFNKLNILVLCK